jgi:replicative superfamily II helicase
MVDFKKRMGRKSSGRLLDPLEIYQTLDRAHDKGPLRPAQESILQEWHLRNRQEQDLIVKLHTGQGKTLIGLLMLQSKLNEGLGPVLYLCPNNYLIEQTCSQAKQFGIHTCEADPDLPSEFENCTSILIVSVQKLFNGMTKFGLGHAGIPVGSIVVDDAHACTDSIRDAFTIRVPRENSEYEALVGLFESELRDQGMGTFEDLRNSEPEAILPVPYWTWRHKHPDVARLLAKGANTEALRFCWPILKDMIPDCQCIISGTHLQIAPYLPPLELFRSYHDAKHRIFMSATVTNDSFLVRGLRLTPATIRKPLIYSKERWSGEKMILIPSLLDESLDRSLIVKVFGPAPRRQYGVVALTPSFARTKDWQAYGATVATKDTINTELHKLRNGDFASTLVIVNRYDGIDLPDESCRILIFDSHPRSQNLADVYSERCRANSEITAIRTARIIEQGLGRSVRGEKDYSVIILCGADVIRAIKSAGTRPHFSDQTRAQIEIGLEIAKMAEEDLAKGRTALDVLIDTIQQCLKRDESWKDYYSDKMESVTSTIRSADALEIFEMELKAEKEFQDGSPEKARELIQKLIDHYVTDDSERGWYLQEIARFLDVHSPIESNKMQVQAHRKNRYLLRPREGMQIDRLTIVSDKRVSKIISSLRGFGDFSELRMAIDELLSRLAFGMGAERFEHAFHDLGVMLGFACQRPDKEWKEGPDNLWGVEDGHYFVIECKSEVDLKRAEINKSESGQMNNACAWFARNYDGAQSTNIMIVPTRKISKAAGFNQPVRTMRAKELSNLNRAIKEFFYEFRAINFDDILPSKVQELLNSHNLDVNSLRFKYSVETSAL